MRIGNRILRLESCSSTNNIAKDLAADGEPEGTVVIAEEQKKGKGRLDRRWHSPRNEGLYLSLVLRPPGQDIPLLTLMGGVALCEAVRKYGEDQICLKWPNDLLWRGKKLGGILCESSTAGERLEYVILGIGLNISQDEESFPTDIRSAAVSLKQIGGVAPDPEEFLPLLWSRLDNWYDCFLSGLHQKIISAFVERSCFLLGAKMEVETAGGRVAGLFHGISSQGGLVLETAMGLKTYFAAEIRSRLGLEEI